MSEKQFEPCTLEEATHVEVNGRVMLLGGHEVELGEWIGIRFKIDDTFIPLGLFSFLGIKPMRERKREPIEFEAIVKASMASYFFLGNVPEGVPLGTKFKCVEILEEGK